MRTYLLTHAPNLSTRSVTHADKSGTRSRTGAVAELDAQAALEADAERNVEETVVHALRHVHVLRPTSLASMVASVRSLGGYLLPTANAKARHFSADRALTLLAVDGATAFYWLERAEREAVRFDSASTSGEVAEGRVTTTADLLGALRDFRGTFAHTPIMLTTWSPSPPSSSSSTTAPYTAGTNTNPNTSARSLLTPLASRNAFLTHRLTVSRASVPRFRAGIGLAGAEADRDARAEVVGGGQFVVTAGGGRQVEFRIGERGVVFGEGG